MILIRVLRENKHKERNVFCKEVVDMLFMLLLDEVTKRKVSGATKLESMQKKHLASNLSLINIGRRELDVIGISGV